MKPKVNVPLWQPLVSLHLVSFGYIITTGYNIGSGYKKTAKYLVINTWLFLFYVNNVLLIF